MVNQARFNAKTGEMLSSSIGNKSSKRNMFFVASITLCAIGSVLLFIGSSILGGFIRLKMATGIVFLILAISCLAIGFVMLIMQKHRLTKEPKITRM